MPLTPIDIATDHGTYRGDPAKVAFGKVNANDQYLEQIAQAASQQATTAQTTANAALPKSGGTVTGPIVRSGVQNQVMFQIQNTGTQAGIGGDFSSWTGSRTPGMQVDAMVNTLAYMPIRVTHWGAKHLFAMDVYEGGSAVGAVTQMGFHFPDGPNRHVFYQNGGATFLGSLTQNSDYRIKEDPQPIDYAAAAAGLRSLHPITYVDVRFPADGRRSGWIAHEMQDAGFGVNVVGEKDATRVEDVLVGDTTPYAPGTEPEGYIPPHLEQRETAVLQNVNYIGMGPFLHAGWIEHDARIAALEADHKHLLGIISSLETRLASLESPV